ncbi:MAG: hypothetical protein Kow0027_03540 [Saprospiraceae bacterium]
MSDQNKDIPPEKLEETFDRILESKLKGIEPEGQMPENLKKAVFDTIDTVGLVAEVVDLFAVKFPLANLSFLSEEDEETAKDHTGDQPDEE